MSVEGTELYTFFTISRLAKRDGVCYNKLTRKAWQRLLNKIQKPGDSELQQL